MIKEPEHTGRHFTVVPVNMLWRVIQNPGGSYDKGDDKPGPTACIILGTFGGWRGGREGKDKALLDLEYI